MVSVAAKVSVAIRTITLRVALYIRLGEARVRIAHASSSTLQIVVRNEGPIVVG